MPPPRPARSRIESAMPIYEYFCESCGKHFEVRRGMMEEGPVGCPDCEGAICRRRYSSVSIVKSGDDRARDLSWVDREMARRLRKSSGGALNPEFEQTLDRMESS